MGAPRQGLNPTTNSVGFTAKLVTVRSISADGATAVVVDRQNTQTSVPMLVQRSKGPLPAPGDTWLIAQDLGMWTFAAFVGTSGSQFAGGESEAGPEGGGGGQVTIAPAAPESPAAGDVWLDSANGNQVSSWDGASWVAAQFGAAAIAPRSLTAAQMAPATLTSAQLAPAAGITAAQVAFTAAQIGGSRVFTGTSQPSGMEPGDLWFNAGDGNLVSVWTGSVWDALLFSAPAIQPGSLTSAQLAQEAGIVASQVAFTVTDIGGTSVSVSAEEPSDPAAGDLWYDSTDGYVLKQWDGFNWVLYQFGTGAIAAGSVTADLVAANTLTAAQLAAGIVYGGIINGTLVEAATFVGSVFEGSDFVINEYGVFFYSGTPAAGNLVMSITQVAGNDASWTSGTGNPYVAGLTVYGTGGSYTTLGLFGTEPIIVMDPANTVTGSYIAPQISTQYFGSGTAGYFETNVSSGSPGNGGVLITTPDAKVILFSGSSDGVTSVAHVGVYGGAAGNLLADINENGIVAPNPASPNTVEVWHPITLDSGWATNSSYAAPSYRLLPDGNLQLTGLADFGSSTTASHNLNNGNPLPSEYRPKTMKLFRSYDGHGARASVQISPSGVIEALGNATYPYQYCEIDAILPLNL